MKKSGDKNITENFFIKTIQDLKGFMVDTFATESELKIFSDKTQSNFENVFSRLDTLETENGLGALHTRELKVQVEEHEKRLKGLEHAKN